jgi:hypothetical protein
MKALTKQIRVSGIIEEANRLLLDEPLPLALKTRVEIIVRSGEEDLSDEEWMRALASNPVFDFLKDPAEDIYTWEDGRPFDVEG